MALQPDGLEIWEYGGRLMRAEHPGAKAIQNLIITTKKGKHDMMLDKLIKNDSPEKYIIGDLERLQEYFIKIDLDAPLESSAYTKIKNELITLQRINKIIECPNCSQPISPKNIISTEYSNPNLCHLKEKTYNYNCDCGKNFERTFTEIDFEELEKAMKQQEA